MSTSIDIISAMKVLGKKEWDTPKRYGPDGWALVRQSDGASVIITNAPHDGVEWIHASIAHRDHMPTYEELVLLHKAVWQGRGYAFQVFAPPASHVNIHPYALHLWGRLDGTNPLPDFGQNGTI